MDYTDYSAINLNIYTKIPDSESVTGTPSLFQTQIKYTIPSNSLLYRGEQIILYYGERPKIHQELREIELDKTILSGPNDINEIIGSITIDTYQYTTVEYIIHYSGFVDADINNIIQYKFENSIERISKITSLTNKYGDYLCNNINLDPLSLSTIFDCNKYNNCIITYEDSAYTNTDSILIFASMEYIDSNAINSAINPIDSTNIGDYKYINNVGNFVYIGKLQPTSSSSILAIPRFESLNISLNVFNCIYILNASGDIITNVKCSLFST